ncbi:ATP-binding SpoIIE family protein phosphatase [Streptomyces sp. 8N706]|uniref:ATP-binding SpoIIE family protein phosphatase n=1 Tax=Streptomyces sp. 8N706 TaxID=3457416 RepID=UPI003FD11796
MKTEIPVHGPRELDDMRPDEAPAVLSLDAPSGVADRDRFLASTASRCLRDLNASSVIVFLRVPGEPALVSAVAAVTPLGVGSAERVSLNDKTYASVAAYRSGRVSTARSTEILGEHPEMAVLSPFPYSAVAAPLLSRSIHRPFGTLTVIWPQLDHQCTEAEMHYLTESAEIVSRELERFAELGVSMKPSGVSLVIPEEHSEEALDVAAQARDDPEHAASMSAPTAYHLQKLAMYLTTVASTEEAARLAIERIVLGFHAAAAAITLIESDRLRVVGASGCSNEFLRILNGSPLGGPSPETNAVTQKRRLTYDADDQQISGRVQRKGDGELGDYIWVILPLLAGDRAVGTCSIGFKRRQGVIAARESALTALVTLLGQTFDRTQSADARRALAQELQQAMLPRMLPQVAGVLSTCRYVPTTGAIELGGDWYDLIELPTGGVAAVVGDVEGHNVSAAVVMGELRSAVRAYASEGHDPTTVLTRTNRLLIDLATGLFATCCCVWLDPDTGVAQIASAGHPPPLIRTADGGGPGADLDIGVPLGIDPNASYRTAELTLEPGSLLTLYTNGLVDPDSGVVPGTLEAVLASSDGELETLGDQLIASVHSRTTHADDSALLLLQYEGPSAEAQRYTRRLEIPHRDLQGVKRARALLQEWLDEWGLSAMADDAEMLTSELVTNALVHGDSDVDVRVRRYPRHIRVEVRDSTPHPAIPVTIPREEDQAEGGRGLIIVSALASSWGNSPSGRGKTVWYELGVPSEENDMTEEGTAGTADEADHVPHRQ